MGQFQGKEAMKPKGVHVETVLHTPVKQQCRLPDLRLPWPGRGPHLCQTWLPADPAKYVYCH